MSLALIPSTRDKVTFSLAVEEKLKALATEHYRTRRRHLQIPSKIMSALQECRPMHKRFKAGGYTHSLAEENNEKIVARWIIEEWHKLKGTQPPAGVVLEWKF